MRGRVINVEERIAGSELLVAIPRAANYIANPDFFFDTTGWATGGAGVTVTRDTGVKLPTFTASGRVDVPNPGASSDRIEFAINLNNGEEYIFRGYGSSPVGQSGRFWVVDSTSVNLGQQVKTGDGGFQYFEVRFTANANNSHKLRWGRVATGAGGAFYLGFAQLLRVLDGAILPLVPYATPNIAGPYVWSGTPNLSTINAKGMLEIDDPTDFEEAGWVLVGDDDLHSQLEAIEYSAIDEDTGVITGLAALTNTYAVGEQVTVYPTVKERVAWVLVDDGDEAIPALVPHSLYDRIPRGVRAEQGETVELGWNDSVLTVEEVIGKEPSNDASFLDFDEAETSWQIFTELFEITSLSLEGSIVGAGMILHLSGTGASGSQQGSVSGHPGVANLDTGTTSTGRAFMRTGLRILDPNDGIQRFGALVQLQTMPGATNDFEAVVGFADADNGMENLTGNNFDAAIFRFHNGLTNWQCCTANDIAGTSTNADSGIPVNTADWFLLEVRLNKPLGFCEFYINDALVATITTNLPDAYLNPVVGIDKTAGTTARQLWVDYVFGDGLVLRGGTDAPVRVSTGTGKTILTRTLGR